MKTKKQSSVSIPIKHSREELDIANWLAQKTKRTRSGAIKWATEKAATELGYRPPKKK